MASASLSLNAILRNHLKEVLDQDRSLRLMTPPGVAVYGSPNGETAAEEEQDFIGEALHGAREALAERDVGSVAEVVADLVERHRVPEEQKYPLALGILEAHVRHWEEALLRSRGAASLWFPEDESLGDNGPRHAAQQRSSLPVSGAV
ncbi:hypothetical protein, partial [Falsiroseomonas sp. E2-1-a20]|uniref:hypothetical protein n=1 Tax=Falsiroseomonas sp. E2-1-a20 TaxID=3239300 RepID=UPI003F30701E